MCVQLSVFGVSWVECMDKGNVGTGVCGIDIKTVVVGTCVLRILCYAGRVR